MATTTGPTRSVERRLSEIFEREVAVFLVPTGTAANALALAHVMAKRVYFVLEEEIAVGSWPRATLNLLDALRYIANADRIFVLSALAGSW
jgi:hypothetical protein